MGLTATVRAYLGWDWDSGARDTSNLESAKSYADGNLVNQAEAVWHQEAQTLLDGESTTLDLSALTRTVLGDTLTTTFLTIKALLIVVTSTTWGAELLVGGAAANEWWKPFGAAGDKVSVPPDSPMLLSNRQWGWAVDASNKNLKLAASGGDVTYPVAILGTLSSSASGSSGD